MVSAKQYGLGLGWPVIPGQVPGGVTPTPTPTLLALSIPEATRLAAPFNGLEVYQTGVGAAAVISHNYTLATARSALAPLVTYWVDKATGNNANAGTQAAPFRSQSKALAMVAASGGLGAMRVKGSLPGQPRVRYLSTDTQTDGSTVYSDALTGTFPDVQVIIEPWNEGELFDSVQAGPTTTWASTADSAVWKSTNAGILFDYANLDRFLAPRRLVVLPVLANGSTEAQVIAAINAAWATYSGLSDDGGPLYATGLSQKVTGSSSTWVRTFDGRNPATTGLMQTALLTGGPNFTASSRNPLIFQVGAGYLGGLLGAFAVKGSGGFRPKVTLANCRFSGSTGDGAFAASGADNTQGCDILIFRSTATGGDADGWNMHQNIYWQELEGGGDWNGWSLSGANNGTTGHDTSKGDRWNCLYLANQDRSVHDVNGMVTKLGGCGSSTRRGPDGTPQSTPFAVGLEGDAGATTMTLINCRVLNGPNGAPQYVSEVNGPNSKIFFTGGNFVPVVGPSATPGQVLPYTP